MGDNNNMSSLAGCQRVLDGMGEDILVNVGDWSGARAKTHEVQNGNVDVSKQGVQRIICEDSKDFKVITKLPLEKFSAWEKANFFPEENFLAALRAIDGVSQVETQTYALETVNLMGKIKVPKSSNGCMAHSLPQTN